MTKNSSKSILVLNWLRGYFWLLSTAIIAMSCTRLVWFVTYRQGDELSHFAADFFRALWLGFRFDLSAFCHLSSLSFLLWLPWLLVGPIRWAPEMIRWQKRLWILLILVLVFLLAADFAFYGYFQDHFNALVFGLFEDDTTAILKTVWKNYPVIPILIGGVVLIGLLKKWFDRLWPLEKTISFKTGPTQSFFASSPSQTSQRSIWQSRLLIILAYFALILGARGTLGLFPLEIMHTAISSNAFINILSFNSLHAMAHAIQLYDQQRQAWNENLNQLGYRENQNQALIDFKTSVGAAGAVDSLNLTNEFFRDPPVMRKTSVKTTKPQKLPHVVVVLMESWGSDWMSKQSPQFNLLGAFAKHKTEDLFTPHLMPSSVATIGSLGSLAVDLPHRFYSPFLTESSYLGVKFATAPAEVFRQQGYQTHFIYGGNLGWRSIDKFLPKQGFEKLHGESEIKKLAGNRDESDVLHDWGVYDEFVFDYTLRLLRTATTPQFIFILTTSNHPPYTLPKTFTGPTLEFAPAILQSLIGDVQLDQDRLKVYQYANEQLGLFLDQIKAGPQANEIIVAATGDHSFYIRPYDNLEFFEKWSVPLYLYLPRDYRSPSTPQLSIGNHIDIFPTLYHLIFSDLAYFSLGQNLLDPHSKPWAFHGPSWSSFDDKYGIIISPKGQIVSHLCRREFHKIVPCSPEPAHDQLRKHLTSMMGTADFIFEKQRQGTTMKTTRK